MNPFIRYFTFLLLILSLVSACEKRIFDRRNKYIGNYKFTYQVQNTSGCPGWYGPVKSGESQGEIHYNRKEDGKHELHINFLHNTTLTAFMDKDGHLKGDCGNIAGGFLNENTINFTSTPDACTSMCSHTDYTVTGQKIK